MMFGASIHYLLFRTLGYLRSPNYDTVLLGYQDAGNDK